MDRLRTLNYPMIAFSAIIAAGLLFCVYLSSVSALGDVPLHQTTGLDGRQEKLLSQRDDMSKWLLGLAYGTLVAVLGLQAKADEKNRPCTSAGAMAACGLLVVSLFAAFLFQEATAWALIHDANLFYGSYIEAPLQLQFFSLVGALILLAVWFFRARPAPVLSLVFLLLVLRTSSAAQTGVACSEQWSESRQVKLSAAGQTSLDRLIQAIRSQAGVQVQPADGCEYTFALADEIRTLVRQRPGESDNDFESEVRKLAEQTGRAGALSGDWASRLVAASMFWKPVPYATLKIDSDPENFGVRLRSQNAGWTPLEKRVSPGDYTVELVEDGQVKCSLKFSLKDGDTKSIRYSSGGCK